MTVKETTKETRHEREMREKLCVECGHSLDLHTGSRDQTDGSFYDVSCEECGCDGNF